MTRLLPAAAALVSAALLLPVAGHAADTAAPYYAATPATAPSRPLLITSGTVWKWNATAYTASKGPQREGIVCELVAGRAGKLSAFTANGQAFDADALARCNARAR